MSLRSPLIISLLTTAVLLAAAPAEAQSNDCDGSYVSGPVLEACTTGHESCGTGYVAPTVLVVTGCVEDWSDDRTSCSNGYVSPAACVAFYSDSQGHDCDLAFAAIACVGGYQSAGGGTFDPPRSCGLAALDLSGADLGILGVEHYACVVSETQAGCDIGYYDGFLGEACVLPDSPL